MMIKLIFDTITIIIVWKMMPKLPGLEEHKVWYNNGKPWAQGFFRNGRPEGELIHWYRNGQLSRREFYRNGKNEGEFKSWHENGHLRTLSYYRNGKLNEERKTWYENGRSKEREYYRDGKLEGERKYWRENGELAKCTYAQKNVLIDEQFNTKRRVFFKLKKNLYFRLRFPTVNTFLISDLVELLFGNRDT